jgi:hypothetical protein
VVTGATAGETGGGVGVAGPATGDRTGCPGADEVTGGWGMACVPVAGRPGTGVAAGGCIPAGCATAGMKTGMVLISTFSS